MLTVDIPGKGTVNLNHVVIDLNGTLDSNEEVTGVLDRLNRLSEKVAVHVIVPSGEINRGSYSNIPGNIEVMPDEAGPAEREKLVEKLGCESVAVLGKAHYNAQMLKRAALSIVILARKGTSARVLQAADVVVRELRDALDMLLEPKRLTAFITGFDFQLPKVTVGL